MHVGFPHGDKEMATGMGNFLSPRTGTETVTGMAVMGTGMGNFLSPRTGTETMTGMGGR